MKQRAQGWTTPEDLRARLLLDWERGRLLPPTAFPLRIPLRGPTRQELLHQFEAARVWIDALRETASDSRRGGYSLEWEDLNHRQLGPNRLPIAAVFEQQRDALRPIGKVEEARRYQVAVDQTLPLFPTLSDWLCRKPLVVLEHAAEWARILAVLRWFQGRPRPGVYLREVDVPGVDTKFIEVHRGLLTELLDRVLAPTAIDPLATGAAGFERRFGLRIKPTLVRMRFLDRSLAPAGLTDLTAPVEQLAGLPLRIKTVFITENDVNGLAFPEVPAAVLLFGRGYALEALERLGWIRGADRVCYWGDLDTHGFALLDRLRVFLPAAHSLLMDRETLLAHQDLWTQERPDQRHLDPLSRLQPEESQLYQQLCRDHFGPAVRLEQERLSFGWVRRAIQASG